MDRYMYVYTAPALKWYVTSSSHNLHWKSFHLQNSVHHITFYRFLTTFSTSRFRISHFLPFGGWQVCHLMAETFAAVAKTTFSFSVADIYFARIEAILHKNINIIVK